VSIEEKVYLCSLLAVVMFVVLALAHKEGALSSADPLSDPALLEKVDELYDALRCERTAEFPTADGADRTIVVYVCHNDSPELRGDPADG